jgi:hypothetical protein
MCGGGSSTKENAFNGCFFVGGTPRSATAIEPTGRRFGKNKKVVIVA